MVRQTFIAQCVQCFNLKQPLISVLPRRIQRLLVMKVKRTSIFQPPETSLHLIWKLNSPAPGQVLKVRDRTPCVLGLLEDLHPIFR